MAERCLDSEREGTDQWEVENTNLCIEGPRDPRLPYKVITYAVWTTFPKLPTLDPQTSRAGDWLVTCAHGSAFIGQSKNRPSNKDGYLPRLWCLGYGNGTNFQHFCVFVCGNKCLFVHKQNPKLFQFNILISQKINFSKYIIYFNNIQLFVL